MKTMFTGLTYENQGFFMPKFEGYAFVRHDPYIIGKIHICHSNSRLC